MRMGTRVHAVLLCMLVAACGERPGPAPTPVHASEPELASALLDVTGSVLFGEISKSGKATAGGQIEIGLVVPSGTEVRMAERLPVDTEAVLRLLPPVDDDIPPLSLGAGFDSPFDEASPALEFIPSPGWDSAIENLRAAAREVSRRIGVTVRVRQVLADECGGPPIVALSEDLSDRDWTTARAARDDGTVVVASPADLLGADRMEALCRRALNASPRVTRRPDDPLALVRAERDGDDVVVLLARPPCVAALVDHDGRTRWSDEAPASEAIRFPFPRGLRNAFATSLVVEWRMNDLLLRRAYLIEELVGAVIRRTSASSVADAGGPLAVRVRYRNSRTGAPVVGFPDVVALTREGRALVSAAVTSDSRGEAVARLDVPADLPPGPATLRAGPEDHAGFTLDPVRIHRNFRVSVVTDRGIYRPAEAVRARVMVHGHPSGRPARNVEVALRIGRRGRRTRVTTSEHGIASATLSTEGLRAGRHRLAASVTASGQSETAVATTRFRIDAFEKPRFLLTARPARIEGPLGGTVPLRVTARYSNNSPVVGAEVRVRHLYEPHPVFWTDGNGEAHIPIDIGTTGPDHAVAVEVRDVDGARRSLAIPVEAWNGSADVTIRPVGDVVDGLACEFEIMALEHGSGRPIPGPIDLDPGGRVVLDGQGRGRFELVPSGSGLEFSVRRDGRLVGTHEFPVTPRDPAGLTVLPRTRVGLVGETLDVSVHGPDGPVALDVLREGVLIRALAPTVTQGLAPCRLDLTRDMVGILTLHARSRAPGATGSRVRILVLRSDGLTVDAKPTKAAHEPSGTAHVDVTVRDSDDRPRAAVLGYWAVDEAALALAPMPTGHETIFDALPAVPGPRHRTLAHAGPTAAPEAIRDALGGIEAASADSPSTLFVHESRAELIEDAASRKTRAAERALKRLRRAYLAAWRRAPLTEIRTAASFREHLRRFVREGWLSADALLDPWGTPYELTEPRAGWYVWRSAGPDLEIGDGDETTARWSGAELWEAAPRHVRLFFALWDHHREARGERGRFREAPFYGGCPPRGDGPIAGGGGSAGGGRGLRAEAGDGWFARDPIRRDFPTTLCFVPEAIVGPEGRTRLAVPLADTITTWRMRLVASDANGAVGLGEAAIRVGRPVHLEPRVPGHLTVGDRIEVPVAVRNETNRALTAEVRVETDARLTIDGEATSVVTVPPRRTGICRFTLEARRHGDARVRLFTTAGAESDATEQVMRVLRHARRTVTIRSAGLGAKRPWTPRLPRGRADAVRLDVFPSPESEALAGFEGLLGEPHGCFEQTSSTLYPMILATEYLRRIGRTSPEIEARATRLIANGIDRLRDFEVDRSGGYAMWGRGTPSVELTAYGLRQLAAGRDEIRMRGSPLYRALRFLTRRRNVDGSWGPEGESSFLTTAYVARACSNIGHGDEEALAWLESHVDGVRDPYALSLAALAFLEDDGESKVGRKIVDRIVPLCERRGGRSGWWPEGETATGARGRSGWISTTALAVQALFLDGRHLRTARAGVRSLVEARGADGRFGTTQSTVFALEALLRAHRAVPRGTTTITVSQGERTLKTRALSAEDAHPVRLDLGAIDPYGIEVRVDGNGEPRATVTRVDHEPWGGSAAPGRLELEVRVPEGPLPIGERAVAEIDLVNRTEDVARQVTLEIGLPPGCDVDPTRVTGPDIQRVEREETSLVIYLGDVKARARLPFRVPFSPWCRMDVLTAPSRAYEYYTPEGAAEHPPLRVSAE
jgi:hypothetical protein